MTSDLTPQFNDVTLLEKQILFGQDNGSITGLQDRAPAAAKADSKYREVQKAKAKKTSEFLKALNDIHDYIERLEQEIEALEEQFRKRDGDEWREKLALKILDADDIPPRRAGESMEAYRERLEPILMDEMLNEDGSIKAEYKNHPELGDYALWAQKQYHLNAARGYVRELEDPYTTPDRKNEILDELEQHGDIEELTFADREAQEQSLVQNQIKDSADTNQDTQFNTKSDMSECSNLFKPIG